MPRIVAGEARAVAATPADPPSSESASSARLVFAPRVRGQARRLRRLLSPSFVGSVAFLALGFGFGRRFAHLAVRGYLDFTAPTDDGIAQATQVGHVITSFEHVTLVSHVATT